MGFFGSYKYFVLHNFRAPDETLTVTTTEQDETQLLQTGQLKQHNVALAEERWPSGGSSGNYRTLVHLILLTYG